MRLCAAVYAAKDYIEALFAGNSGGHGADHTLRVYRNAMAIAEGEICDPDIVALDEMWWSRLPRLGRRDQLSLMWCLRRCGIPRDYLLPPGQNTRNHPGFRYLRHK